MSKFLDIVNKIPPEVLAWLRVQFKIEEILDPHVDDDLNHFDYNARILQRVIAKYEEIKNSAS